jgi:hypothetical protein
VTETLFTRLSESIKYRGEGGGSASKGRRVRVGFGRCVHCWRVREAAYYNNAFAADDGDRRRPAWGWALPAIFVCVGEQGVASLSARLEGMSSRLVDPALMSRSFRVPLLELLLAMTGETIQLMMRGRIALVESVQLATEHFF